MTTAKKTTKAESKTTTKTKPEVKGKYFYAIGRRKTAVSRA